MSAPLSPRDRLLATASQLFYNEGIHSVGVDRLVSEANVTRATFYRHFPAKEDLVVAYLRSTDEQLREVVGKAAASGTKAKALEAVFELVGQATCSPGFRGCHFINAAAEYADPEHPVRVAIADHRKWFHGALVELATQAKHSDPQYAASALVLLHDGALAGGELDDPQIVKAILKKAVHAVLRPQRS